MGKCLKMQNAHAKELQKCASVKAVRKGFCRKKMNSIENKMKLKGSSEQCIVKMKEDELPSFELS